MKVFKRSKAYGAFEYAVIIALVIVAALIILKIVKGKTNPTFLDTSKAAVDNYIAETTTKIEESVPDTSGIVVDFSEFRYTTISAENVAADILAALKTSNIAKDKNNVDISNSLEILQGADTLHGVGKRTVKLRATDEYSNTKDFFKTIILTQTINDDFLSNYLKAVITEMGVEFSSEEDFNTFLSDFFDDDIEGELIKDILKAELLDQIEKAEINKNISTLQEGSQPRQIAISVSDLDSVIDNLYNKYISYFQENNVIISDEVINSLHSNSPYPLKCVIVVGDGVTNYYVSPINFTYSGSYNPNDLLFGLKKYAYSPKFFLELYLPDNPGGFGSAKLTYNTTTSKFEGYTNESRAYSFNNATIISQFVIGGPVVPDLNLPKLPVLTKSWTSPYTGMQTVTIPIPSQSSANKISTYTEPSKFIYKTY